MKSCLFWCALGLLSCNQLLAIEKPQLVGSAGAGGNAQTAGIAGIPGSGASGSGSDSSAGGYGGHTGGAAGSGGASGQAQGGVGVLTRVSISATGEESVSASESPGVSDDGRFISFVSSATNLLPDDWDSFPDVFVRDRTAGTTTRVSVGSKTRFADGSSFEPSISGNGQFLVFASEATNLVEPPLAKARRIFRANLQAGATPGIECLTPSDGVEALEPAISNDGKVIVFELRNSPGFADGLYRTSKAGDLACITVGKDGKPAEFDSSGAALNVDGSVVAFSSYAANLVSGDTNDVQDIFVWRLDGSIERVSVGLNGQANGQSFEPSISLDGRFVAFVSSANNLVFGDTNDRDDVFVRDLTERKTERVSVTSSSRSQANGGSWSPSLSSNGRLVAFVSEARNLITKQNQITPSPSFSDVFVHDRESYQTLQISVPVKETTHYALRSEKAVISPSARVVAFTSGAPNLIFDDNNERVDVFAFDFLTVPWL